MFFEEAFRISLCSLWGPKEGLRWAEQPSFRPPRFRLEAGSPTDGLLLHPLPWDAACWAFGLPRQPVAFISDDIERYPRQLREAVGTSVSFPFAICKGAGLRPAIEKAAEPQGGLSWPGPPSWGVWGCDFQSQLAHPELQGLESRASGLPGTEPCPPSVARSPVCRSRGAREPPA